MTIGYYQLQSVQGNELKYQCKVLHMIWLYMYSKSGRSSKWYIYIKIHSKVAEYTSAIRVPNSELFL